MNGELFESDSDDNGYLVRIAVEGCGHGTLNNIYSSVEAACKAKSWPGVDLLIIGGDFQAVRNSYDLNAMAVPAKYREIGDFHEYYSGKRKAPYLTLFIGGNHEASNHLTELYYGGWVAPNIYYMGAANVLRFGPLRIAGMSGIWKGYHYRKPHYERLPYQEDDKKSVYHVRELDVRKLLQLRTQIDVGLSHDWPEGIQWCGDWKQLFQHKKFLEQDARSGRLGNVAAKEVLQRLRPRYWFSAHLHTKFTALVKHNSNDSLQPSADAPEIRDTANTEEIDIDLDTLDTPNPATNGSSSAIKNSDEIDLDLDDSGEDIPDVQMHSITEKAVNADKIDTQQMLEATSLPTKPSLVVASNDSTVPEALRAQLPDSFKPIPAPERLPFPENIRNEETKFLALNKCLPKRDFLQLIGISAATPLPEARHKRPFRLEYDKEWLAITRVFAKELVIGNEHARVPRYEGDAVYQERILTEEKWVEENIVAQNKTIVPNNFELTAPVYDSSISIHTRERPVEYANKQTDDFCSLVQIDNPLDMSDEERSRRDNARIELQNNPPSNDHRGGHGGRGHSRGGRGGRGRGWGRGRGTG